MKSSCVFFLLPMSVVSVTKFHNYQKKSACSDQNTNVLKIDEIGENPTITFTKKTAASAYLSA